MASGRHSSLVGRRGCHWQKSCGLKPAGEVKLGRWSVPQQGSRVLKPGPSPPRIYKKLVWLHERKKTTCAFQPGRRLVVRRPGTEGQEGVLQKRSWRQSGEGRKEGAGPSIYISCSVQSLAVVFWFRRLCTERLAALPRHPTKKNESETTVASVEEGSETTRRLSAWGWVTPGCCVPPLLRKKTQKKTAPCWSGPIPPC